MFTIGNVARRVGDPVDTIRYYERLMLISAQSKTSSGYRLYSPEVVDRIRFIKCSQRCGLSLDDVAALLDVQRAGRTYDTRAIAREKLDEVRKCRSELDLLAATLVTYLGEPSRGYSAAGEAPAIMGAFKAAVAVRGATP